MNVLLRLLDTTDPSASMRHAAFGLVVVCSIGWLTYALYKPGLNGDWVLAFTALLAAVGAVKVAGKPVGAAAPTSQAGSPVVPGGLGSTSEEAK